MTLAEKWHARIVKQEDGCWNWVGARWVRYGKFHIGAGKRVSAHRWGYELLVGPIPEGKELDHLCRNIWCVNPDHLEPVTHTENVRRGAAGLVNGGRGRAMTHCKAGHAFSEENTRLWHGRRLCRKCDARRANEHRNLYGRPSRARTPG